MPDIMEGSILIMSKAGIGTAMFNMGKITSFWNTCERELNQIHNFFFMYLNWI